MVRQSPIKGSDYPNAFLSLALNMIHINVETSQVFKHSGKKHINMEKA